MNRFIILFLFLPLSSFAANRNDVQCVRWLYSNSTGLFVEQCSFSDSLTAITMSYQGKPYTWFTFASSTYASDETGKRHRIIRADSLRLDEKRWLGDDGKATFTLYFDPLPIGTKIFDIIEGQLTDGFRIYGIHDTQTMLNIPKAKESLDAIEPDAHLFRTDTTVIRGCITNYNRTMPHIIRVERFSPNLRGRGCDNGLNYAKVNADGTFQAKVLLDYPQLSDLTLGFQRFIPFYAHPGDTLDIRIDNYGEWDETYTYKNISGHLTLERLMQCRTNFLRRKLSVIAQNTSHSEFSKELNRLKDSAERLLNYWAWKYNLTPWESHLLKSNWRLNSIITQDKYRSEKLYEINQILRENQEIYFEAPKTLYDRFYLREVNWNDSSLLVCSDWNPQFAEKLQRDGFDVVSYPKTSHKNGPNKDLFKSRWETYTVRNPIAQSLIDSLVARSKSRYSVLLFMEPGKNEERDLFDFLELASEFEGEDFHFILTISQGHSSESLNIFLSKIHTESMFHDVDIDICTMDEEQMIILQETFQSVLTPFNATLTNNDGVLCETLHTYGDNARTRFRELQKYERNRKTTR